MILVVDNYDSFTWNLVQYLGELGAEVETRRNDEFVLGEIAEMAPKGILVSPGPKRPEDTEPSNAIFREYAGRFPIFGVCLGHQCLAHVYGARVVRAERLMHGKTSQIRHVGTDVFQGLPDPFEAMRYHSLVVDPSSLPAELTITAWTDDSPPGSEIMGLAHRTQPVWGVQFHPESVGTASGTTMIRAFLEAALNAKM